MRKIPKGIWAAVIFGWIASSDVKQSGAAVAWLVGVLIVVIAYYAEKQRKDQ